MSYREIVTRGDLPHWYMPGAAHFVTYRLVDTLPLAVLRRLRTERDTRMSQPPEPGIPDWTHKARVHKQFFAAYDRYLDQSSSVRWLENPDVARIIIENLYHHHQVKYQLLEYSVMPNHVHVLLVPILADAASIGKLRNADAGSVGHVGDAASIGNYFSDETTDANSPLSEIMHSLKSYTANQANKLLQREGGFWQKESYDHWVRDAEELARIAEYIANNAVLANLTKNAHDWPYCSAYDRQHPRSKPLPQWW